MKTTSFFSSRGFHYFELINIAHSIRKKILQYTGLPVSIGIGKTKTLAKVANYVSKKEFWGILLVGFVSVLFVGMSSDIN